jgi:hypothetical protein
MEYANELTAKSIWKDFPSLGYPSTNSLESFCHYSELDTQRMCFSFFPHIAVATLQEARLATSREDAVEQVRDICESLPTRDRDFCAHGFGEFASPLTFADFPVAVQTCQTFSRLRDIELCVHGMILYAVQPNKMPTILRFCDAQPDRLVRGGCYTTAFAALSQGGGLVSKAVELCSADEPLCLEGAKNYANDPLDAFDGGLAE